MPRWPAAMRQRCPQAKQRSRSPSARTNAKAAGLVCWSNMSAKGQLAKVVFIGAAPLEKAMTWRDFSLSNQTESASLSELVSNIYKFVELFSRNNKRCFKVIER